MFDGSYTDFSDEWFEDIAFFFISPLFLETIAPITGEITDYCFFIFYYLLDRNFSKKTLYKTKHPTALAYADQYSGPETCYYEKYPRLMNIIFVSMFYGFGQPFFFVLTLAVFIVSYYVEKFVTAFHYQKPPMYDDTLSNNTVYFLKWGGFFYIAIGWWSLTNRQMFDNVVLPLRYQEDLDMYGHTVVNVLTLNRYLIVFFAAIGIFLLFTVFDIYDMCKGMFSEEGSVEELMDIEQLPEFPTCLTSM